METGAGFWDGSRLVFGTDGFSLTICRRILFDRFYTKPDVRCGRNYLYEQRE